MEEVGKGGAGWGSKEERCTRIDRGAEPRRIRERRTRQGRPTQEQVEGKWYLKGFSTSPGNTKPVAGMQVHNEGSGATGVGAGCSREEVHMAGCEAGQGQGECVRMDVQWGEQALQSCTKEGWR